MAPSLDMVTSYIVDEDQLVETHNRGIRQYANVIYEHLVETERTQGAFDNVRDGLRGDN